MNQEITWRGIAFLVIVYMGSFFAGLLLIKFVVGWLI